MTQSTSTTTAIDDTKENNMQSSITGIDQEPIADLETLKAPPEKSPSKPTKAKKASKEPMAPMPDVRILKVSRCPSLSGRSELTYHIGCTGNAIQLRVYQNTGKGYFNQEWVRYNAIQDVLTDHEAFSAGTLRSIFVGKSVNTAGFFLAVLKHLELVETSKSNQRLYTHTQSVAFESAVAQLIASDVSIEIEEPQKAKSAKSADISSTASVPTSTGPSIATPPSNKKGTLKLKKA